MGRSNARCAGETSRTCRPQNKARAQATPAARRAHRRKWFSSGLLAVDVESVGRPGAELAPVRPARCRTSAFGVGTERDDHVKVAILLGSLLAAIIAGLVLRSRNRVYDRFAEQECVDGDRDGVPGRAAQPRVHLLGHGRR